MKQAKLVMLGESAVGKSSIILRLVQNAFNANMQSTLGAAYQQKLFSFQNQHKESIILQLFDTCGQESASRLNKLYYRSAQAVLLCYDASKLQSINAAKNWYQSMKQDIDITNMKIVLIANKADLINNDQRQQIKQQNEQLVKQLNLYKSYIVSAKTGEGINELFNELALAILEEMLQKDEKKKELLVDQTVDTNAQKSGGCC